MNTATPIEATKRHVILDALRGFGPLEWIWRCLTYLRLFPITRLMMK